MPVRFSAQRTTFAVEQFDGPDDGLMSTLSTSVEHRSGSSLTIGGCGCPGCMGDRKALYINADQRGGGDVVNGRPSFDVSEAAVQLTRGAAGWGPLGQATTVTYAFRSSASVLPNNVSGFTNFTTVQIQATLTALQSWSDVAGIVFERQDDGTGYSNNATILFGNYATGAAGAAAFAYTPGSRAISSTAGDVWVNISQTNNSNSLPLWGYGQLTLVHEIGHAIGLRHPSDYNASEGVSITYSANASYAEDSNQYTVMSYFRETNTGASYGAGRYAAAPLLDDIAAAQLLYGANMSTRTGDTTYGFNSTAGRAWFSATLSAATPIFAVWDAGGVDTFDFSGYSTAQLIDLRQGAFSNLGSLIGNVSIAIGAVIENAIGGAGNDTIYGNSADNRITPGGGNNQVDGGLGTDTLVFSGAFSSYTITITGREGFITGAEGTTRFLNVEFLAFSDMTIAAPAGTGALTLSGDMTNDTIDGSEFGDTLFGAGGNDVINGLAGSDQLTGGRGNDTLNGGSGNDLIYIDQGNDIIAGGEGVDTLNSSLALGGLQIDLQLGTISGGGMGVDTVSGMERVIGTRFNDVIIGGAEDNYIQGLGGIDTLRGGGGNDELVASAAEAGGGADVLKLFDQANSTIASAVSLDGAFDRLARDGVRDAEVIPHATVVAVSHGGLEYYAFTVNANQTVTFDIDGAAFDSTLRVFDAAGTELADNDDAQYAGDVGPATDSFLTFTFSQAGTYYVQVGQYASAGGTGYATTPPPAGLAYTLHISVPGHATQPTSLLGSQLFGDAGDDILRSSLGSDVLNGGDGSDIAIFTGTRASYTITVSGDVTTVSNAEGSDTVTNVERLQFIDMVTNAAGLELPPINGTAAGDTLIGTNFGETINGLDGSDVVYGLDGNDIINGGAGNDYIDGGGGADQMYGGTGNDLYIVDSSNDLISEVFGAGADIAYISVDYVLEQSSEVETLVAVAGAGAISLTGSAYTNEVIGNAYDNLLRGGDGNDSLFGDDGNDRLMGDGGNDGLFGGRGSDVYVVDSGDAVTEAVGEGIDLVLALENFALSAGQEVEYLEVFDRASTSRIDLWGNEFGNTLTGGAGVNILRGEAGNDTLYGLAGDDYLDGGAGIDVMQGGVGNDTYYVDNTSDLVVELGGEGTDRIATAVSFTLTAGQSIEVLEVVNSNSTENIDLRGNGFDQVIAGNFGNNSIFGEGGDDVLAGYAGADILDGGEGNDVLIGGEGVDQLIGGSGNDKYYVDNRNDVVTEASNGGNDTVASSASYRLAAGSSVENLEPVTFGSSEALNFSGNEFANRILGNNGNNIINGGAGSDRMEGLGGSDTFVFSDTLGLNNIDTVEDFAVGVDKFLLDSRTFNDLALGTLGAGAFVTGSHALDADDRIIYDRETGTLWFDADGSGSVAAVQFAVVRSGLDLAATDFMIGDGSAVSAIGVVEDAPGKPVEGETLPLVEDFGAVSGVDPDLTLSVRGQPFRPSGPAFDALFGTGAGDGFEGGSFATVPDATVSTGGPSDLFGLDSDSDVSADLRDAFVPLPGSYRAFPVALDHVVDLIDAPSGYLTFGAGDDPRWMLTLLPSTDGQIEDPSFGHPPSRIDPWG